MNSLFIQSCQQQLEQLTSHNSEPAKRSQAFSNFLEKGMPHSKNEAWKYLKLFELQNQAFRLPPLSSTNIPENLTLNIFEDAYQLVFIDGIFQESLSNFQKIKPYFTFNSVSSEKHLISENDNDVFINLNNALYLQEINIEIPENIIINKPLLFIYLHCENGIGCYPRKNIKVGKNSHLTVLEEFFSIDTNVLSFTNAFSTIELEKDSKLHYYYIQRESKKSFHFYTQQILQNRNSEYNAFTFITGGQTSRFESSLKFQGTQARCQYNGIYLPKDKQQMDIHLNIEHLQPQCKSSQFYKGIVADQAKGIFYGKVKVCENAFETDAKQINKNLLLSKLAEVNIRPQLEIEHDHVICSHGATVGQLDEDALFYLQSRGISPVQAKQILKYAFAQEVFNHIRNSVVLK